MVGVNTCLRKLGTVAIFATLLAASVNCDTGCTYHIQNASDFTSRCFGEISELAINSDPDSSPNKKVLIVQPHENGCIRTKHSVAVNSTSPVILKYYKTENDDKSNVTLRLVSSKEFCPDDECLWDIARDPLFEKTDEWVTIEHKFPLKKGNDFFAEIEISNEGKGKILIDSLSFPTTTSTCRSIAEEPEEKASYLEFLVEIADNKTTDKNKAQSPSIEEFSKNLLLTAASVLTLNNLLN